MSSEIFDHFWWIFEQDYKSFLNLPIPSKSLYIYPQGYKSTNPSESSFNLHDEIHVILREGSALSMIIQGAAGSGKTSMALKLCNELWSEVQFSDDGGQNGEDISDDIFYNEYEHDRSQILPLYIHLATVYKYSKRNDELILNFIQSKGKCNNDMCNVCRDDHFAEQLHNEIRKLKLILILDGYNELSEKVNLWEVNKWENVEECKLRCIYFLRPDTFSQTYDMECAFQYKYVGHITRNYEERKSLQYSISPLKVEQRQSYFSNFVKYLMKLHKECNDEGFQSYPIWPMTVESTKRNPIWLEGAKEYQRWFKKLPSLKKISQVPFILQLIMQVLPSAVEDSTNDPTKIRQYCGTEVGVFDAVVKYWFEFQANRVHSSEIPLDLFKMDKNNLIRFYHVYCENLAAYLVERNKGSLTNLFLSESETKQHFMTDPVRDEEFNKVRNEKYSHIFPSKSGQEDDTKRKLDNLIELRNGCFLQAKFTKSGTALVFQFLHHSMLEYFAAKCIFQGLRGELNYYLSHNVGLCPEFVKFNRQPIEKLGHGVFYKIIVRARIDDDFCQCLFDIISKSSEVSILKQMAANAATVLNFAGRSLSGLDWKEVQIPSANLSRTNCANTDFSGANLSQVKFQQSYMPFCKFNGTNFTAANFGEINSIRSHALSQPFAKGMRPIKQEHILELTSCRLGGCNYLIYSYRNQIFKCRFDDPVPIALDLPDLRGYHAVHGDSDTPLNFSMFTIDGNLIGRIYGDRNQFQILIWNIESGKLVGRIDQFLASTAAATAKSTRNLDILSLFEGHGDNEVNNYGPERTHYEERIFSYSHKYTSEDKPSTTSTAFLLIHSTFKAISENNSTTHELYSYKIFPWHCEREFFSKSIQTNTNSHAQVLCTSSAGKFALCYNRQVKIVDAKTGGCECTLPVQLPVGFEIEMTYSDNAQFIAYSDFAKTFILGNAENYLFDKIPFENSAKAPRRLLFDTPGNHLLASFEYTEELLLIATRNCQVLRVIKPHSAFYSLSKLQGWIHPKNFCFCAENDTHIAYVDASNVVNIVQVAQDDQSDATRAMHDNNLIPQYDLGEGELAINIRYFTVSKDELYIAICLDNSDSENEDNLKIYFTPLKYSESLLSETSIKEIRAKEFCAVFTGTKENTNLIVLASYGYLSVFNIFTCDILYTGNLGEMISRPELNTRWFSCIIYPYTNFLLIEHGSGEGNQTSVLFTRMAYQSFNQHPYLTFDQITSIQPVDYCVIDRERILSLGQNLKYYNDFMACEVYTYTLYVCHFPSSSVQMIKSPGNGEQDEINSFLFYGSSNLCFGTTNELHFYKLKYKTNDLLTVSKLQRLRHGNASRPSVMVNCPEGIQRFFVLYENGRIEHRKTTSGKLVYAVMSWFSPMLAIGLWNSANSDSDKLPTPTRIKIYVCNIDGFGTFTCLQAGEKANELKVVWDSKPCLKLEAGNCDIGNCFEMDSRAIQLFKTQPGIIGTPFPGKSYTQYDKRSYIALCDLLVGIKDEICSDEMRPIISAHKKSRSDAPIVNITRQLWSVCAIVKKNTNWYDFNPHMSLTLEGIKNNRRFLVKADLSYMRHSDGVPKEVVILTKPFTQLEELQKLKDHSRIQQFYVSNVEGMKLLEEIRRDQRTVLTYNIAKKNCKSWVKGKLKIVNKSLKKHWYDIIVDYPR